MWHLGYYKTCPFPSNWLMLWKLLHLTILEQTESLDISPFIQSLFDCFLI